MRDFPDLSGGCFCRHIRYRVTADPLFTFACHCTDCQQMTASAYSLGMAVPGEAFVLTHGQPRALAKTGDSGGVSTRYVCPDCAIWTHTRVENSPDTVIVRPQSLDDRSWVAPVGQIFTGSAHRWALLDVPLSWEREFKETARLEAAFATSDIRPGRTA